MTNTFLFELGIKAGESLLGTGNSFGSVLPLMQKLDPTFIEGTLDAEDFCAGIDSVAFECEVCNWWCPAGEAHNDGAFVCCDDCYAQGGVEEEQ